MKVLENAEKQSVFCRIAYAPQFRKCCLTVLLGVKNVFNLVT